MTHRLKWEQNKLDYREVIKVLQAKCAELEQERDQYREDAKEFHGQMNRLVELNNNLTIHRDELMDELAALKAQAGESYPDGMTAEDDKAFNRQWDVK